MSQEKFAWQSLHPTIYSTHVSRSFLATSKFIYFPIWRLRKIIKGLSINHSSAHQFGTYPPATFAMVKFACLMRPAVLGVFAPAMSVVAPTMGVVAPTIGVFAPTINQKFGLRTVENLRSLEPSHYLANYQQRAPRLLLFDNNGCLRQKRKSAPGDLSQLPALLTGLCNDHENEVWVVSGQDVESLQEQYVGLLDKINLAAEHGSVIRRKNEAEITFRGDVPDILPLRRALLPILEEYQDVVKKEFLHLKRTFVLLYKMDGETENPQGKLDPMAERHRNRVNCMLEEMKMVLKNFQDYQYKLQEDLGHVEIKHKNVCKGEFSQEMIGKGHKYNFGISVGDKDIDEKMHKIMNKNKFISIVVSKDKKQLTNAQYKLQSFKDVHNMIEKLNQKP